jgi:hypothetical protein
MSELDKSEVNVIIMELEKRINTLIHSNANLCILKWSLNKWKVPHQAREIKVLKRIVQRLKDGIKRFA